MYVGKRRKGEERKEVLKWKVPMGDGGDRGKEAGDTVE